jgi:hypothetical protein
MKSRRKWTIEFNFTDNVDDSTWMVSHFNTCIRSYEAAMQCVMEQRLDGRCYRVRRLTRAH